jgi:resuscitation-promoting factor RpfB
MSGPSHDPPAGSPWRRSLERSHRRRAAARRRRLRLRGRNAAVFAVLTTTVLAGAALATTGGTQAGSSSSSASASVLKPGSRGPAVAALQRRLGVQVTGYYGPQTRRAVRRFQARRGLRVDGIAGPATLRALGIRVRSSGSSGSGSGSSVRLPAVLRRIAQCESGGNPRAVSPNGRYRGKYQFDRATWRSLGGTGDPAAASEAEQDRRALALYRRAGTSPWPNCA